MGLFGGSAQASINNQANIDFSPFFQFGDGNTSAIDKQFNPTATQTPKLDDSTALSAAITGQGSAESGDLARSESSPYANETANAATSESSIPGGAKGLLIGGALLAGGYYLLTNKKAS